MTRYLSFVNFSVGESGAFVAQGSIHNCDLLGVNYSLNNGLYCNKGGFIHTCYLVNLCVD